MDNNLPKNIEGNPEYEAALNLNCPDVGGPCIRQQCKKWVSVQMAVPNALAPMHPKMVVVHQCQDDTVLNMLAQIHQLMAMQSMAQAQRSINLKPPQGMARG
jgi:hypothetical protein